MPDPHKTNTAVSPASAGQTGRKERSDRNSIPSSAGSYSFLWLAVTHALFFSLWFFLPERIFSVPKTSILGVCIITLARYSLCLFLPFLYFSYQNRSMQTGFLGRNPGISWVLLSFLMGIPCALLFMGMRNFIIRHCLLYGWSFPLPAYLFPVELIRGPAGFILFLFVGILLPVFASESFFRGLMQPLFPRVKNDFFNIVTTAFLFCVFYLSITDFIPLFILGLIIGLMRKYSGNILCGAITALSSVLFLFLSAKFFPYLSYFSSRASVEGDTSIVYGSLITLIAGVVVFLLLLPQCRKNAREEKNINRDRSKKEVSITGKLPIWPILFSIMLFVAVWAVYLDV